MSQAKPHILLLEPYYGGSHRAFLQGLRNNLPYEYTLIGLPARKWKMRMQLAAPWMADEIIRLTEQGMRFDAILCSTFIDAATLRALLSQNGIMLPLAIYYHENQFAYPNQADDPATFQFAALNFTSALSADAIAFNSCFNRESFFDGVKNYLKKAADMDITTKVDELRTKSTVLYPGIEYAHVHSDSLAHCKKTPVIVWNHRWEHDKDPETFFYTLMKLSEAGSDFKLIVLGQNFLRCPEIFAKAEKKLKKHILHFGYVPDRSDYMRLLHQGNLVVSTAVHEFFGMAVLEAVRCGCRPLVPDRLSYRELFPKKYRYRAGEFAEALASLLKDGHRFEDRELFGLTDRYSWQNVADDYRQWLGAIL